MALPTAIFSEGRAWDGTTENTRPNLSIYVTPDGEIGDRYTSEIIALEQLLKNSVSTIGLLENLGPPNSLLGVRNDAFGLEYKTLVPGAGIIVTYNDETIILSAQNDFIEIESVASEDLIVGDILCISNNGKVCKAQANDITTSKVIGCCNKTTTTGNCVPIISFGIITNPNWTLIPDTTYYLSPYIAGALIPVPPSILGQYLVPIGIALSPAQLVVNLQKRVRI